MNILQIIFSLISLLFTIIFLGLFRYNNFSIAQITFSEEHAQHIETKKLVRRIRWQMILLGIVFFLLSFLGSLDLIKPWVDFFTLAIFFVYLFLVWYLLTNGQKKLVELKKKNQWQYEPETSVSADLKATRERGKAAPSGVYAWLIWLLSFLPLLFLFFDNQQSSELWPMLVIMPLILIIIPIVYPNSIKRRQHVLFDDSNLNQTYAAKMEKLEGRSFLLIQLITTIFFIVTAFNLYFFPYQSTYFIVSVVIFLIAISIVIFVTQTKRRKIEDELNISEITHLREGAPYKWGFYNNPHDCRIFVPKQLGGMGTTINVGQPLGKAIAFGVLIILIAAVILILTVTLIDFEIQLDQNLEIKIPFYGYSISPNDVAEIRITSEPLNGVRINGVGGINRAFGQFDFEDYGSTRAYLNNEIDEKIIIELADTDKFSYLIFNKKSKAETLKLFDDLEEWVASTE
ncbi:MAG: hypothetical protein GX326_05320 [Clostridiaceae bacterium]|nr:hypothetical protein [Clostridiaceae bacterium]